VIVHYDGTAWSSVNSVTPNDLHGIWGSSATDVYAVGLSGTILHYDGTSWTAEQSGTSNDLYGVWGSSATNVYAVGNSGTILHYDGTSWSLKSSGTNYNLRSVWGSSSTDVFAVGDYATILHYQPPAAPQNPVPATTSISPTTMPYGSASFTMTVNGSNFISGSSVLFNGLAVATTYVSATQLTAVISPAVVTSGGNFNVTVINGPPGGGTSNAQTFTVTLATTTLSVLAVSGTYGGSVTLSATLTSGGSGVSGRSISFSLNGTGVGTAFTNNSGVATLAVPLGSTSVGLYPSFIGASFAGDSDYVASSGSANLTVTQVPTFLSSMAAMGTYGGVTGLYAFLTLGPNFSGAPVPGEVIRFTLNGTIVGSATTDASGYAAVSGVSLTGINAGTYSNYVVATFAGDTDYAPSSTSQNLVISPANTTTLASDVTWTLGSGPVTFSATVTSSTSATVNEGYVNFTISWCTGAFSYCAGAANSSTGVSAPVTNGKASASVVPLLPFLSPPWTGLQSFTIQAYYLGTANFSKSQDLAHNLTVYVTSASLSVSLAIPQNSQPADPSQLTLAATVSNLGPETAYGGAVEIDAIDPNGSLITGVGLSFGALAVGASTTVVGTIPAWNLPANTTLRATPEAFSSFVQTAQTGSLLLNGYYYSGFQVLRDGYSFANHASTTDLWDLYVQIFGESEVEWCVYSACAPKPWAYGYYKYTFQPGFSGDCYGMAASSLQFFRGVLDFHNFNPWATSVYALLTNYAPDDPTWVNVETYQGFQYGDPIQSWYSNSSQDPVTTLTNLEAAMYGPGGQVAGTPDILSLWGTNNAGHAVVPYRIVEATVNQGDTMADIYVYDNNFPGDLTQVVEVDRTKDTFSSNYAAGYGMASGYAGSGLGYVPSSLDDASPTLPWIAGAGLMYAAVSGPANMLITNAQGQSVGYQNGTLVEQIPGARKIRPMVDSSGNVNFPEAYRLPGGQYTTTISGNDAGSVTATFFSAPTMLTFTSPSMAATTHDSINLSQDGSTVALGTDATNEQYSSTLSTDLGNAAREATVSNTSMASGEKITLALVSGAFQITNQGAAKSYDLTLDQVGAGAGTISFTGLSMQANETDTFTPSDWTNLGTAPVNLQITNAQGTTSGNIQSPAITSANSTSFTYGTSGTFTVTATGFPQPVLIETGTLPSGVSFNPSTGVLSGTPASGSVGIYNLTFTAKNAAGSIAQSFTLTVNPAPLTITASTGAMTYGGPPFVVGPLYSGFVNGDSASSLSQQPVCAPPFSTVTPAGTYTTSCSEAADPNYTISYKPGSVIVSQASSAVSLTSSSPSSDVAGQALIFTATVTDSSSGSVGTPTGTVQFIYTGAGVIASAVPLTNGVATFIYAPIWAGTATAVYSGDNNFMASNSNAVSQTVTAAPIASIAPAEVQFIGQDVRTTSQPQPVTISNIGTGPLNISSVSITGSASDDFSLTNNCTSPLAGLASSSATPSSCIVYVSFTPDDTGVGTATLAITDNDPLSSPQLIGLTGLAQSAINSDFNRAKIAAGNYIWFSAQFVVRGPVGRDATQDPVQIFFTNSTVTFSSNGVSYNLPAPNAVVVFSPTATAATTTYDTVNSRWVTTVPSIHPTKMRSVYTVDTRTFLTGFAFLVPAGGLPGDIHPVTWSGSFASDTPGVSVQWRWGAAVYTQFSTDYNALGVKPVEDDHETVPPAWWTPDPAGTPENYKQYWVPGASADVRDKYTGDASRVVGVSPVVAPLSLSPTELNFGSSSVGSPTAAQTVTLANNGVIPLTISNIQVTGTNASDFVIQSNTCAGLSALLPLSSTASPANSCTLSITFTPGDVGTRSAVVAITSGPDANSQTTQTVDLGGRGTP
jgi:hypothetical protein